MLAPYLRLPRAVYVLCLGTFVNRAGTLLAPFITIYMKEQLGQGVQFATLTMGVFGLGSVLGQAIGGHLTDRLGRRPVMLMALFGGATMMCLLAVLKSAPLFVLGVFALALVAETLRPAVQSMLADLVPALQRPTAFALMYVSVNLGFAVAPMIGGLLAERSFTAIFLGNAAAFCGYGLIVLFGLSETMPVRRAADTSPRGDQPDAKSPADAHRGFFAGLAAIGADRTFVAYCFGSLLLALLFMQSMSTFPLYLAQLGYRPATYGWIIAINGWLIVLLQVPVTAHLAPLRRERLLVAAALLTTTGFGLHGVATVPWQFAVAVAVWTLGEIVIAPLAGPIIADLAPLHLRGRYMGVFGLSYSGANMLGAPLGGLLLATLGAPAVWTGCVALGLVATLTFWRIGPRLANRGQPLRSASTIEPDVGTAAAISSPAPRDPQAADR